jgi:nucleotide-binding universal stress UspA family protein
MFKHILIPTDGSDLSIGAVRQGVKYAKESGASITVLTVTPPFNAFELGAMLPLRDPEEYRKLAEEQASRRLAAAGEIARGADVPCETVHVEHDRPYQAIIETARATATPFCSPPTAGAASRPCSSAARPRRS